MLAALLLATPPSLVQDPGVGLLEPVEIRALVVRLSELDVLGDSRSIAAAMDRLAEIGFGAVVPLAWERGRTLAKSPALVAAGFADAAAFPGRDVLGEIVFEAHRAGLEVLVGLDGTLTFDATQVPKIALAPGATDRPDPRDAGIRAAARGFALELARAAEIDGFVLVNGLAAHPVEGAREATVAQDLEESARELLAWRAELRAFDAGLVVGWAALDPRFRPPIDARALDFVVVPPGRGALPAPLTAWIAEQPGRAASWRALDDELAPEAFSAFLVEARVPPFAGEFVGPFGALDARESALADVLNQGIEAPYYARATLPWRHGVVWRPAAELVEMVNDSGTFEDVDAEIPYATLAAGRRGNASWAMRPHEPGAHELWVWLQPGIGPHGELDFTIPVDPRRVQRVKVPAGEPRGWTRIGRVHLGSTRKEDVLRLEVREGGANGLAIGPLVALPRRRLEGR